MRLTGAQRNLAMAASNPLHLPLEIKVPWALKNLYSKQDFDPFGRFCRVQVLDRQTHHATGSSVAIDRTEVYNPMYFSLNVSVCSDSTELWLAVYGKFCSERHICVARVSPLVPRWRYVSIQIHRPWWRPRTTALYFVQPPLFVVEFRQPQSHSARVRTSSPKYCQVYDRVITNTPAACGHGSLRSWINAWVCRYKPWDPLTMRVIPERYCIEWGSLMKTCHVKCPSILPACRRTVVLRQARDYSNHVCATAFEYWLRCWRETNIDTVFSYWLSFYTFNAYV